MKITVIAVGSRGDIQPYIALGAGLQRAGHGVRIVTNKDFTELVRGYGLEVWPVDVDVQAALRAPDATASVEGGGLLRSFQKLSEIAKTSTRLVVETGLEAARGSDALLAGFGGMLTAASLAEKLGLPFIQAYNVPLTPTAAFPGALFPRLSVWPRPLTHRLAHWLTRQVVWQAARMAGNGSRRELLGLPPAPLLGMLGGEVFDRGPLLYGFSPSVIARPADWGQSIHVTGYWFADEPGSWSAPEDLLEFLEYGPAPVYIGFGSMASEKPEQVMRLLLEALARHGRRAVIHSGWAGLSASSLPENVRLIGPVPHSWLFPRVAAVVHHGGAGTTAAGLRAGVPSVVVPFHGDQHFWGYRVAAIGAGPNPIPRTRLTGERLAGALEEALTNPEMRQKAARIGAQIRAEDGVTAAVKLIEEYAARGFRPAPGKAQPEVERTGG